MKISIITVVYNAAATIRDSIQSVISQSYFSNVEYIIIDGGSTDGTLKILNEYRDLFSIFVSEKDNGIYDAMNKGISLASGHIVGILNADDIFADSTALQNIADIFESQSKPDIVYRDLVYVKKDDVNSVVRLWKSMPYYETFFENGNVPPHPSLYLRSSVYQKAGMFDLSFKLAADYEFMLRIFKKFDFKPIYDSGILVKMRYGGATNKSLKNIITQNAEIVRAWKKNNLKMPFTFFGFKLVKRLIQFIGK